MNVRVANDSCSEENGIAEAIGHAFRRVSSWHTPPHWSRRDWLDEVQAILHSGAVCAGLNYDQKRGVPLRAHIYMRSVAAVWGRYRQEWSYYLHTVAESDARAEPIATPFVEANDNEDVDYFVGQALNQLSVEDRLLIRQLFWDNSGQHRVAAKLQISQQCVSRRKTRVLRQLRCCLRGRSQLFSHILAACWALFDSLDLLPIIDLL